MTEYVPAVRHSLSGVLRTVIERVKDGNAAGTGEIDPTEVEDEARCLTNEPCLPQTSFEAGTSSTCADVDPGSYVSQGRRMIFTAPSCFFWKMS